MRKLEKLPPSKAQIQAKKEAYPEQYKQIEKAKKFARDARIKLGLEKKKDKKKKLVLPAIKETEME